MTSHPILDAHPMLQALVLRAEQADKDRRGELYFQAGLAAECVVNDSTVALELFARSLAFRPDHRLTIEAISRIAADPTVEDHSLLDDVGFFDNPHVEARHKHTLRLARAEVAFYTEGDSDAEAARVDVDAILAVQPGHRPARLLQQAIAVQEGDFLALAEVARVTAQSTVDDGLRVASFYLAAKLAEDAQDDPQQALDLLGFALEGAPLRPELHVASGRVARRLGDVQALAARLDREVAHRTTTDGRIAAAIDAAYVHHWQRDRPEDAIAALLSVLDDLDADRGRARDAIVAREVLVEVAAATDAAGELTALRELSQRLPRGRRQAAIFTRIGQLMLEDEALGDIEGEVAVRYLEAALDADTTYRPAMVLLDELYAEGKFPTKGRDLLRRRGLEQGRPDFLVRAAEMTLEGLGRVDEAVALLRQAIALSDDVILFGPDSPLDRLLELIQSEAELAPLEVQAVEDALAVARTDHGRRRLLDRFVRLAHRGQGIDPARLLSLTETHHLQLSDPYLADRLANLFAAAGRWSEYAALRRSELDALENHGAERVLEAMYEIGQIHDAALHDRAAALGWFRAVVDRDPTYKPAVAALEQVLIQTDGWTELTRLYEGELTQLNDADRASSAFKMAMIAERTPGDEAQAASWYDQVLLREPNHLPSIMGAMRLADVRGDLERWAELAASWADRELDDHLAAALHCEVAEVLEDHLGDTESAAHAYRVALERSPHQEIARMGLIRTLFRLNLHDEAAEVAGYPVGAEDEDEDAASLEVATGVAMIARDPRAYTEQVVRDFPDFIPSRLAALRHALEARDNLAAAAHARHLGHVLPDGPIRAAWLRMATLLGRLAGQDLDYSIAHELLDEPVIDEQVLLRMEAYMRDNGDLEGLARIMSRHAGAVRDDLTRASYLLAYGRLLQARGHADEAIDVYEQILEERPGFLPAVKALKLLTELTNDREAFAEACEREGTLVKDQSLAVHDFLTAGEIRRRYLGDIEGAIFDLETVLKLEPTNKTAFDSLREIYSMRAQPKELYHLMQRRAEAVDDAAICKDLLLRMAEIAFSRLGDNELAKRCHQQVLELDPLHIQSYRILAELYESEKLWERAVDCLVGVLGLTEDKTLLALTYRKIADIYDTELKDVPRAIEAYRSLLRHDPNRVDALRRLAVLLHGDQRWEEAAKAYGSLLQRERSRKKLKGDLLALSRICLDGLADPLRAEQCLTHALRLDSTDAELHEHLIRFYQERGETQKINEHLTRTARQFATALAEDLEEGDVEKLRPSLEGMFRMADRSRDRDRSFVVSACATALAATTDEHVAFYEMYREAGALRLPSRAIPIDMTDTTIPAELSGAVLNVLRYADEPLRKLKSAAVRDYGAGRRTRVSERDGRPGADVLFRWPTLFSLQDVQLHVVSNGPEWPVAIPGEPSMLIIDETGLDRIADGDPQYLFRLGRAIAPLSMGIGGWVQLPDDLLVPAFAAAVRSFSATYLIGDDRGTHPQIEEDRIRKHMSRVPERLLIPHIYEITAKFDANAILMQRRHLERAFCRLALIPVFNPVPVLELLRADGGLEAFNDGLGFVLQERLGDLRRAVGVALD